MPSPFQVKHNLKAVAGTAHINDVKPYQQKLDALPPPQNSRNLHISDLDHLSPPLSNILRRSTSSFLTGLTAFLTSVDKLLTPQSLCLLRISDNMTSQPACCLPRMDLPHLNPTPKQSCQLLTGCNRQIPRLLHLIPGHPP